jgi:hypothetical protein
MINIHNQQQSLPSSLPISSHNNQDQHAQAHETMVLLGRLLGWELTFQGIATSNECDVGDSYILESRWHRRENQSKLQSFSKTVLLKDSLQEGKRQLCWVVINKFLTVADAMKLA